MKKLFLASIIVMIALFGGCTNDLGNDNSGGHSGPSILTVNISAPKTKVALGDKDSAGKYPVYWSEGDRISVNGVISEEAAISATNAGSAQFEFKDAVLNYPYNLLYPASESDRVAFAEVQHYTEGTFECGTTPMYAYVESATSNITLKHLSGVLRFGIKGASEGTTLSKVVIKAGSGHIVGDFAVDFAAGTLSAADNTGSTLEYSFGEGLPLSTTKSKEFFVALPCGDFGMCIAEFYTTDGESMSARFNASASASIKAGVIREFADVTFNKGTSCTLVPFESEVDDLDIEELYAVRPSTTDGDYLVINNQYEMVWLLFNKPTIKGVNYSKIRIGDNIDFGLLDTVPMPSMRLFDNTEIDGNGKSIKGVTIKGSSIFGDTKGLTIRNLTFADCSVESTATTGSALLTGKHTGNLTVSGVVLNNCSVVAPCKVGLLTGVLCEGTHAITDVEAVGGEVRTSFKAGASGMAGGFVGCITPESGSSTTLSATFTNCKTSATVSSYMEGLDLFYGKMVGVLNGYNGDEKLHFVNCDGANASLVPLYDQGSKIAESAILSFCEAHRGDFCQTTLSAATDNLLGGEKYCRGEVCVDGARFQPEWDGKRSTTILTEVVDGITRYLIYSPYDLAKAQGQKYSATKSLVFMTDVDMGGHLFKPIEYVINLDGQNHELHNLKVDIVHNAASNYGAGFIVYANNATTHKDLTFVGADINCNHDATIAPLAYGDTEDGGAGNAYAGVLVSRSWRTAIKDDAGNTTGYTNYIVSNVRVRDSKVRGVCKVGGLIGACRGQVYIDNCSVDNSIIENYDPKVINYYTMKKSVSASILGTYIVEGLQWWYTAGECGGLIGFLEAHYAEISNCAVTNTQINCTGQPNKVVVANVWSSSSFVEGAYKSEASVTTRAETTIAGRHINQFIGNLRSRRSESQQEKGSGEYTNKIIDYTLSGNTYNGVAAESTNEYNHNYASGKYCDAVGCVYYTGVDISIVFSSIHVSECAGTLTFQPKGGESVTLTEAIGKGNNMDWFGGDGKMTSGKSYYPPAPTE